MRSHFMFQYVCTLYNVYIRLNLSSQMFIYFFMVKTFKILLTFGMYSTFLLSVVTLLC